MKDSSVPKRSAILVLGMHRSGTSALAGVLSLCGAKLPQSLMAPVKGENDKGFFESVKIAKLNDELLKAKNSGWDDGTELDNFDSPEIWINRIVSLVEEEFDSQSLIVLKDPRICRLIPIWQEALKQAGYRTHFVLQIRHPEEVAQSLNVRNGFSKEKTFWLWLQHILVSEKQTRNSDRTIVHYDNLLDNWQTSIAKLIEKADIDAPSKSIIEKIDNFLSEDFKRQRFKGEMVEDGELARWVKQVYEAISLVEPDSAFKTFDDVKNRFDDLNRLLKPVVGNLYKQLYCQFDAADKERLKLLHELEREKKQLGESERQNTKYINLVSGYQEQVSGYQEQVSGYQEQVSGYQEQVSGYQEQVSGYQEQVSGYQEQVSGYQGQISGYQEQLALGKKQLEDQSIRYENSLAENKEIKRQISEQKSLLDEVAEENEELLEEKFQDRKNFSALKMELSEQEEQFVRLRLEHLALKRAQRRPVRTILNLLLRSLLGLKRFQSWEKFCNNRKDYSFLKNTPHFDSDYYTKSYPDILRSGLDPLMHYVKIGAQEGRNPSKNFNSGFYTEHYLDIKLSGVNPLVHYIKHGCKEGRLVLPEQSEIEEQKQSDPHIAETKEVEQFCFLEADKPTVSVIVPVFNNLDFTVRCLYSLSKQKTSLPFEVIVADDCSTDETQEKLSGIEGLVLCRQEENLGFLRNCNEAAKLARGQYLIILNNDTEAQENFIQELIGIFETNPGTGLVGAKLVYPNGVLQEAGGLIFEDASGWNIGRIGVVNVRRYNFIREVDYCSGAGIAIRKDLWRELDGFDLRYAPAYYEDTDLAFKVREAGKKVIYNPFAVLTHHEGISSGTDIDAGIKKHQALNQPVFRDKWNSVLKRPLPEAGGVSLWYPYRKKRLLWIDACTPTPDQDSGSVDAFNFLKIAAEAGWAVTFVGVHDPRHQGIYTENLQRLGIEVLYSPFFSNLKSYLKEYGKEFDVVIGCRITVVSDCIEHIRKFAPKAQFIFNTVDLHFLRAERELKLGTTKIKQSEVTALREQELRVIQYSDATILISPVEQKLIAELSPEAKTVLLPIIREIPGSTASFDGRRDIAFIGGFRHTPNVDAVLYFVEKIWPSVRGELPEVKFIVAGSHMPDQIRNIKADGVVIKGFIPELGDLFNTIRLTVAPLRFGAGMKGKVVTSLGYGVPVIASEIASEGMSLEEGEGVVVAKDDDEMVDSILEVYRADSIWGPLSREGLKAVERQFSIEAVKPDFLALID